MQWEVAERLVASSGTRAFGYLSVAAQLVCDVELLRKVPPDAFLPPPKVDSALISFTLHSRATELGIESPGELIGAVKVMRQRAGPSV